MEQEHEDEDIGGENDHIVGQRHRLFQHPEHIQCTCRRLVTQAVGTPPVVVHDVGAHSEVTLPEFVDDLGLETDLEGRDEVDPLWGIVCVCDERGRESVWERWARDGRETSESRERQRET